MNAHNSTPVLASKQCIMPSLAPTKIRARRSTFAVMNAGYVASGGGSSDGGVSTAGVEEIIAPSGWLRTALIRATASGSPAPENICRYGRSVAAFVLSKDTIVPPVLPSGRTVKMLREFAAGSEDTHIR